jgi:hypothetical protein
VGGQKHHGSVQGRSNNSVRIAVSGGSGHPFQSPNVLDGQSGRAGRWSAGTSKGQSCEGASSHQQHAAPCSSSTASPPPATDSPSAPPVPPLHVDHAHKQVPDVASANSSSGGLAAIERDTGARVCFWRPPRMPSRRLAAINPQRYQERCQAVEALDKVCVITGAWPLPARAGTPGRLRLAAPSCASHHHAHLPAPPGGLCATW